MSIGVNDPNEHDPNEHDPYGLAETALAPARNVLVCSGKGRDRRNRVVL
jgi:hypothetical protein